MVFPVDKLVHLHEALASPIVYLCMLISQSGNEILRARASNNHLDYLCEYILSQKLF